MTRRDVLALVTGATGFIGRAVVARLRSAGYPTRGLVRPTSDTSQLERDYPEVGLRYGDLSDPESLVAAMDGCDWVLNCAGLNSFWERDATAYQRINVEGTQNVMLAALEAGVAKVVHVSTVMAYGFPDESPFREESAPGPHKSAYASSKYRGDQIAWELHETRGLPLVVVYLAAVLGAGDPKAVMQIARFLQRRVPVMIDSESRFTYVAIGDAAEAIVRAAEKPGNVGERYLVGNQRLTTAEYFQTISDLSGVPMPHWTIGRRTTLTLARLMAAWSGLTGTPPAMPLDLMRTAYARSLLFDGSKAEQELGIEYTPSRLALAEAVADIRRRQAARTGGAGLVEDERSEEAG
jgi:dihydroflavonol-4-reductase